MIGIGWVNDEELASAAVVVGAVVVTDSSVVGKVVVPLAFTGAEEVTTAVSLVGNNGGALAFEDGAGDADVSAAAVSGLSGRAGWVGLGFFAADARRFLRFRSGFARTFSEAPS